MTDRLIDDNQPLLDLLWRDMMLQSSLHRPGPYWERKMLNTYRLIRREGLAGFRANSVGISFADNPPLNILDQYAGSKYGHLVQAAFSLPLISQVFKSQLFWTESNYRRAVTAEAKLFDVKASQWLDEILEEFEDRIPSGIDEGCNSIFEHNGRQFSMYYLTLLSYIDVVRRGGVDLSKVNTILEVGGGMGANLHLLLTLFPNIKRAILVDVPPVLYVSGQYLKKYFKRVVTYESFKDQTDIGFSNIADDIEIIAIPPWKLPDLKADLDLAWNSNSFVEMSESHVEFYVEEIASRLSSDGDFVVISYDNTSGGSLSLSDLLARLKNFGAVGEIDGSNWDWFWQEKVFCCAAGNMP